jgi:LysR family transcriptional regulator of gallate degradation
MEMQQLRHFIAASEHGNLGKAARALNITQPALSRSIKNLEQFFDAALLERTRRGVVPTVFGESLLSHARVIINERHRAIDDVAALKGLHHGHVTLGITSNFAGFIVPQAIGALTAGRPGLRISVVAALYDEILARLRRAEIDVAFSMFPTVPDEPDLQFETLCAYDSHVYARADHGLARKRALSLRDLADCGWVVVSQPIAMHRIFYEFFERHGVPAPAQVVKTDSIELLKSLVVHSGLLTILPDHLVAAEAMAGDVVCLARDTVVVPGRFGVISRQRGTRSPAVTALIEALRTEAARTGAGAHPKARRKAVGRAVRSSAR